MCVGDFNRTCLAALRHQTRWTISRLSGKAFFDSSVHVERDEFATCTKEFLRRAPEIQALAWVPRVPHSERCDYEVAGMIPDWDSHGHAKYFMTKILGVPAA